jgi:serine phosphatase RsbU (regulator of sigma subunit)
VVMCSDGIEESLDGSGEELGKEQLRERLLELSSGSAREIADGLLAAADRHAGGNEPSDDRTVLVLKVV